MPSNCSTKLVKQLYPFVRKRLQETSPHRCYTVTSGCARLVPPSPSGHQRASCTGKATFASEVRVGKHCCASQFFLGLARIGVRTVPYLGGFRSFLGVYSSSKASSAETRGKKQLGSFRRHA